jgi:hypothetical protein
VKTETVAETQRSHPVEVTAARSYPIPDGDWTLRPNPVYNCDSPTALAPVRIADRLTLFEFDRLPDDTTGRNTDSDTAIFDTSYRALSLEAQDLTRRMANYWPHLPAGYAFGSDGRSAGDNAEDGMDSSGSPARDRPRSSSHNGKRRTATGNLGSEAAPSGVPRWYSRAEDFVAAMFVLYLAHFSYRMRWLTQGLMWTAVLVALSVASYPFEPEAFTQYASLAIVLAAGVAVVCIIVAANRNPIISRITQTTPNRFNLTWPFIQATVVYVIGPALFVAAQLSGKLRVLFDPILDVLR